MSHKFEIKNNRILLDGVDISETVAEWSMSFNNGNMAATGGKSPFAVVLRRVVYDKENPMKDDSGICTYNMILNDVEISIEIDGRVKEQSKIVLAPGLPEGMKKKC